MRKRKRMGRKEGAVGGQNGTVKNGSGNEKD